VRDNGCGFDTKAVAVVSARRLGIQSMRERAAMLGGTLRFTSPRAKGQRFWCRSHMQSRTLSLPGETTLKCLRELTKSES
jgi:nitrate/nitrite-specific signal transduction histidine kinase